MGAIVTPGSESHYNIVVMDNGSTFVELASVLTSNVQNASTDHAFTHVGIVG